MGILSFVNIELSKELLIHSNKTLYEIANIFCFSSEYHFSNTFKNKTYVMCEKNNHILLFNSLCIQILKPFKLRSKDT